VFHGGDLRSAGWQAKVLWQNGAHAKTDAPATDRHRLTGGTDAGLEAQARARLVANPFLHFSNSDPYKSLSPRGRSSG
jgi:hypothetical protein